VFDVRKAEQRALAKDESRGKAWRGAKALGEVARSAGDYDYIRRARGRLIDAGDRPAVTRRGMQSVWFRARFCLEWRKQLEREQRPGGGRAGVTNCSSPAYSCPQAVPGPMGAPHGTKPQGWLLMARY
jgi:hypothetical protein